MATLFDCAIFHFLQISQCVGAQAIQTHWCSVHVHFCFPMGSNSQAVRSRKLSFRAKVGCPLTRRHYTGRMSAWRVPAAPRFRALCPSSLRNSIPCVTPERCHLRLCTALLRLCTALFRASLPSVASFVSAQHHSVQLALNRKAKRAEHNFALLSTILGPRGAATSSSYKAAVLKTPATAFMPRQPNITVESLESVPLGSYACSIFALNLP